MRYQLPDGMTSISAAGRSFEADIDGVIDVPHDAGADVHRDLQDKRLWGLTALEEVPGTETTGPMETQIAAVSALPTAPVLPAREHKKNLLALLRGFGHVLDGRCTFEFLRRKVMTVLHEMDPESLAAAAKAAANPTSTIDEIEAAINAGDKVNLAPDGSVSITKQTADGPEHDQSGDGETAPSQKSEKEPAEPPTDPAQGAEDAAPTQEASQDDAGKGAATDEPADPLTAPIPPVDPAATPSAETPAAPGA